METIAEEATMVATNKCSQCGKFATKLADNNQYQLPPGIYCCGEGGCGWHELMKSRLDQVLPRNVQQMVKDAPENETIRSVVLRYTLVPIPDGLVEYEAIARWIQFNIQPRLDPAKANPIPTVDLLPGGLENPIDTTEAIAFGIYGTFTREEYGRCDYRHRQRMREAIHVSVATLDEMLAAAVAGRWGRSAFIRELQSRMRRQALADMGDIDEGWETIEEDHEGYEQSEDSPGNYQLSYSQAEFEALLQNHLARSRPEQYQQIYMRP